VIGSKIQIHFFSGGVFQVLIFSLKKFPFISKVSGWFCRVAKIGFKVFRFGFGQLWF